jgi:hypothetical protein
MATLDIIDDDDDHLEFVPVVDHGVDREDIVAAEQKIAERSTYGGYETDPVLIQENQRHHEMLQELIGKFPITFYPAMRVANATQDTFLLGDRLVFYFWYVRRRDKGDVVHDPPSL